MAIEAVHCHPRPPFLLIVYFCIFRLLAIQLGTVKDMGIISLVFKALKQLVIEFTQTGNHLLETVLSRIPDRLRDGHCAVVRALHQA
jgi:hypothetical protein